ncbi:hypothetical protein PCE1_004396 [Barthelona sp. PCE]
MSYREVSNFVRQMKVLGFPHQLNHRSFQKPNFNLMKTLLQWLVQKYDSNITVIDSVETEEDRVFFVRSVVDILASKGIRLNGKRLYQSTSLSVRELLKISKLVYKGHRYSIISPEKRMEISGKTADEALQELQNSVTTLRNARSSANNMSKVGTAVFDILQDEDEHKKKRLDALSKVTNVDSIEAELSHIVETKRERLKVLSEETLENRSNLAVLTKRLNKRNTELQRNEKRLKSLESIKPSYLKELENLRSNLSELHEHYVDLSQNVAYLNNLHEEKSKKEMDDNEKEMEELKLLRKKSSKHLLDDEDDILNHTQIVDSSTTIIDDGKEANFGTLDRPVARPKNVRSSNRMAISDSDLSESEEEDSSTGLSDEDFLLSDEESSDDIIFLSDENTAGYLISDDDSI